MNSSNVALLVDRRPGVSLVPPARRSEAEDAIKLCSAYGLTPDDWQADVLDGWLGVRSDGKWAASMCGLAAPRQNGKNGIIEIRELYGMVLLGEQFLHTAHEVKTARKAFQRLASFFENTRAFPELAALVKEIRRTNGQEAIVLDNGGSVEFIARSKGSGRGYTVDTLVLDEAQQLSDDAFAALQPTISVGKLGNPQTIFTGTPPAESMNGEVFTRIRRAGMDGTDPRLCWVDYGCEGALPDVEDHEAWARHNPTLGVRLHAETVMDELAMMKPETFARERLGWWGDPEGRIGAFGLGQWEACHVPDVQPPTAAMSVGVAVSYDRAWSSIGAAAPLDGNRLYVGAVDRRRGVAWLTDRLLDIQAKHDCPVVIDGRGPAATVITDLTDVGVRVTVASTADVLEACGGIFDRVQEQRVVHGGNGELDDAVAGAAKRPVGDRWAWGRKTPTDVSMLEAVTLAHWSATVRDDPDLLETVW